MGHAPGTDAAGAPVILVVDDDVSNRDLIDRFLQKDGLRIIKAANGADAIAAYCRNKPVVVLLDLHMPNVDGFEFLRWLRQEPEIDRAPAIVLTGSSERASVEQAAKLGASGYLVKPIDGDEVRQRVRSLLPMKRSPELV